MISEISDDEDFQMPVVVDAGSSLIRAGIAEHEAPTCIFPSRVGSLRFSKGEKTDGFIGKDHLQNMQDLLSLRCPIERGIITNWDDMELLMSRCYKELNVNPKERALLFAETPLNPKSQQERFAQMMFETFESPAIAMVSSSSLCEYQCGNNSGVMVNIGDGVSYAVPIYTHHCMEAAIHRQDFAGRDITACLQKSLLEKGYSFTTTTEFETVRDIKEKLSYTALDFDAEMAKKSEITNSSYKLSDGTDLKLGEEKFTCMEALFQPSKFGFRGFLSIQDMIYRCIESCEMDTKAHAMYYIYIAGGTALNAGFNERLKKEMELLLPKSKRINVRCYPKSPYSVWIGGSYLGSLPNFQTSSISKQAYEEYGPSIMYMPPTHLC